MKAHKYADLAWPSLFVIVTATYAYWASQRELVSSRPLVPGAASVPNPVPTPGIQTLHSRMWEDPLSIANHDWRDKQQSANSSQTKAALSWFSGKLSATPPQLVTDEQLKAYEKDVAFAASLRLPKKDVPEKEVPEKEVPEKEVPEKEVQSYQQHFADLVSSHATICLPVFLPGGPYAESKEKRMRIRYSLVTALAESGFHLEYPQRMSYLPLRVWVRTLRGWTHRELVLPIKLYRSRNSQTQVLVLWVDESQVGLRPLLATHRILNELFLTVKDVHQPNLDVALIGPATSGMLKEMATEVRYLQERQGHDDEHKFHRADHWRIQSYSDSQAPSVMTGYCPLLSAGFDAGEGTKILDPIAIYSCRATIEKIAFAEQPFFILKRVMGTDVQLVQALRTELQSRGALPGKIVLITEHDTAYGRQIQETFEREFRQQDGESDEKSKGETTVSTYKILKGLDGALPGDTRDTNGVNKSKESATNGSTVNKRLPEGRSQFDYLTRLPEMLHDASGAPAAIGIVGSDVYDKLLVLRALKPKFPDSLFFTTDADAIFLHPNELPHTRNLLVATHFDLRLCKNLQRETAPFRESYQTASFLATRLAVVDFTGIDHAIDRLDLVARTSALSNLDLTRGIEGIRESLGIATRALRAIQIEEYRSPRGAAESPDVESPDAESPDAVLTTVKSAAKQPTHASVKSKHEAQLQLLWMQLWTINEALQQPPDAGSLATATDARAEQAAEWKLGLRAVAGLLAFDPHQSGPVFEDLRQQLMHMQPQVDESFQKDLRQWATELNEAEDGYDLLQLRNKITAGLEEKSIEKKAMLQSVNKLSGLQPRLCEQQSKLAWAEAEQINGYLNQHGQNPWLTPLIQVVGRNRLHKLPGLPASELQSAGGDSEATQDSARNREILTALVHPQDDAVNSLNAHAFATMVMVAVVAVCCLPAVWPAYAEALSNRGSPIAIVGLAIPMLGGLATFLAWRWLSEEQAAPFDGYSTGSRDLLFFFCGTCSLSSIVFVAGRYRKVLTDSFANSRPQYSLLGVILCLALFLIYTCNIVLWGGESRSTIIAFSALIFALLSMLLFTVVRLCTARSQQRVVLPSGSNVASEELLGSVDGSQGNAASVSRGMPHPEKVAPSNQAEGSPVDSQPELEEENQR